MTNKDSHTSKAQTPVTEKWPFWYGGFGGVVACVITHPLDLAKVRLQTVVAPKPTLVQMVSKILKHDGITGLYGGLSAALLRQCTYSTTRFGVYEYLKENYVPPEHMNSMLYLLPISMVSGGIGGFVGNPADVVNIRMQNDNSLPIEKRRGYKNAIDGLFRITKEEGVTSLFRGLTPNLVRGVLMTSSQVVTYDIAKSFLVGTLGLNKDNKSTHFSASLLAGLVATTICSPADVIKTRIMNSHHANESAVRILFDAVKAEGPGFMFRGWLPSFVRLGPNTIIIFLVVEQLRKYRLGM